LYDHYFDNLLLARIFETKDSKRFFSSGEIFWFCWAISSLLNRRDDSSFKKGVIFIGVAISTNLIFFNTGSHKLMLINITENPAIPALPEQQGFYLTTKLCITIIKKLDR
jgi:hypothetical protein